MRPRPDDKSPDAPIVAPRGWLRATIVAALAMVFVAAAIGFVGFLSQLRGAETKPPAAPTALWYSPAVHRASPMRWNCWPAVMASGC